MSAIDVEADLGSTHEEPEPRDDQLVDEPTSTTEAGTRIHQVTLWTKSNDTPRIAAGKENPRLQSPSVPTRLVSVTEAVDPHPRRSVTRGVEEENACKQV